MCLSDKKVDHYLNDQSNHPEVYSTFSTSFYMPERSMKKKPQNQITLQRKK